MKKEGEKNMKSKIFPGFTLFTSASLRRVTSLSLTGFAMIVMLASTTQKAYAHFPTLTASASCSGGAAVINYTVGSWNPGGVGGSNPDIRVFFDGAPAADGALDPNTNPPDQFSGTLTAPQGTNTVDVVATAESAWDDGFAAGDSSSVVTVTIPTDCAPGTGRFTGGGKQVTVDGIAVTKGFEVDCDLHQPSNNLEINWGSEHFHMTAFLSAVCTLVKKPNPPTAPVNTIVATGTGRYNNSDGYTVEFTLIDNGEPGTSDEASFKVYETANPSNVVLDTGGLNFISGGNIQAHVDQH